MLGNLPKGDMTIADFNLKPKEVGADLPIKFEISYTSNDGIRQVEEKQLTLYSAPFSPSVESGVPKESGSSSFKYKAGFAMLACAICVVGYKKHQKKMEMRNAQEKEFNEMKSEDPDR